MPTTIQQLFNSNIADQTTALASLQTYKFKPRSSWQRMGKLTNTNWQENSGMPDSTFNQIYANLSNVSNLGAITEAVYLYGSNIKPSAFIPPAFSKADGSTITFKEPAGTDYVENGAYDIFALVSYILQYPLPNSDDGIHCKDVLPTVSALQADKIKHDSKAVASGVDAETKKLETAYSNAATILINYWNNWYAQTNCVDYGKVVTPTPTTPPVVTTPPTGANGTQNPDGTIVGATGGQTETPIGSTGTPPKAQQVASPIDPNQEAKSNLFIGVLVLVAIIGGIAYFVKRKKD